MKITMNQVLDQLGLVPETLLGYEEEDAINHMIEHLSDYSEEQITSTLRHLMSRAFIGEARLRFLNGQVDDLVELNNMIADLVVRKKKNKT